MVAAAVEPGVAATPAWLQWTTWVLSLGGLGVSIYLTIAHFNTSVTLACPATSTVNCEKVTTSPESYAFGIPVAVLGLAFYLFLAVANSPWVWRMTWPPIRWARVGSMVVGILFVLYLVYAELFKIGAICLWCTSVHVITFALFVLIMFSFAAGYGTTRNPPWPEPGRPSRLRDEAKVVGALMTAGRAVPSVVAGPAVPAGPDGGRPGHGQRDQVRGPDQAIPRRHRA